MFWLTRYDVKNGYHFTEEILTTFETFLVLDEDPQDYELVIFDGTRQGVPGLFSYWPLLFGKGVRLLREKPFPAGTCFPKSVFCQHPGISQFSLNKVNKSYH